MTADGSHRGSIFAEDAEVLTVSRFDGEQFILRLAAPRAAAAATPGSFAHLRCDEAIPMRRPLSIMRADPAAGWIEVLFKVVGDGLRALAARAPGDRVSVLAPIGRGFAPSPGRRRPLLVGGGVGIPPMVFLAEVMKDRDDLAPLVLMGSELPFPFDVAPSPHPSPWLAADVNGSMPLLNDWNVPNRLATLSGFAACFDGYVTGLAEEWLRSLDKDELAEVEMFACGPTPMLEACADVARRWGIPCQVSLEEYMACAVGGCAGCTVLVHEPEGPAMKRVCVDGPVFDAARVFPGSAA